MYLFRFRDLVAKTLDEHRAIITAEKQCLWGWWKRPTEDTRRDVWDELAAATAANPIKIGLFNSGADKVFEAEVIGIIPPLENGQHPPVPAGEEKLVPEYYRDSPFSFGWLRLKSIADTEYAFFNKFSIAERPALPNYPQEFLDRLVGNIIVDGAELRGMDTTIWRVRPRQATDRDERIVTSPRFVVEPISQQPIAAPGSVILHITDPHYAIEKHRDQHVWRIDPEPVAGAKTPSTLVDAIKRAVDFARDDLEMDRVGIVLVTGDLTFMGAPKEFEAAGRALQKLLGALDLGPENLVILPGNHDIVWSPKDPYDPKAPVTIATDAATENYRAFYKDMLRHTAHESLGCGRRYLLPNGMCVEIAAVNSSSLDTGKDFLAGVGRVQEDYFNTVADGIGWGSAPSMALRILALHHHLALTEDLEPFDGYGHGFGIAVDAPRIQRMAAAKHVQLAIHGHKHRAFVWRSDVYKLLEQAEVTYDMGAINIVGGGSAGSSEVEANSNFFNLIDVSPERIAVQPFRSRNKGAFENIPAWCADVSISPSDGLLLSKWRPLKDK